LCFVIFVVVSQIDLLGIPLTYERYRWDAL
jgi:hypothetical protein